MKRKFNVFLLINFLFFIMAMIGIFKYNDEMKYLNKNKVVVEFNNLKFKNAKIIDYKDLNNDLDNNKLRQYKVRIKDNGKGNENLQEIFTIIKNLENKNEKYNFFIDFVDITGKHIDTIS